MSTEIEIIDPTTYPGWNDLIAEHEETTIFHTSNWAKVLKETYSYKPAFFTIFDNGKISSMIPLMNIRSRLTGNRGVALPFSDFCPPISGSPEALRKLIEFIRKYGRMKKWKYLEFRNAINCTGFSPDGLLSYYLHNLDIRIDEDEIFKSFSNTNRRNIRKSETEGVEVEISGEKEAVREYYRLHGLTRKIHGMPPQPFSFFKNIHELIISDGLGFVCLGSYKKRIISGVLFMHFRDNALYKFGASDRKYQYLRPNNLIMWEAIKYCRRNGVKYVNFGRTDRDQKGLIRYKDSWGAKRSLIQYERYGIISRKTQEISKYNPQLQGKFFEGHRLHS